MSLHIEYAVCGGDGNDVFVFDVLRARGLGSLRGHECGYGQGGPEQLGPLVLDGICVIWAFGFRARASALPALASAAGAGSGWR